MKKNMKELLVKVDWKKVAKIGGCVLTGVMAFASAVSEQKAADKLLDMEARLKNLESK